MKALKQLSKSQNGKKGKGLGVTRRSSKILIGVREPSPEKTSLGGAAAKTVTDFVKSIRKEELSRDQKQKMTAGNLKTGGLTTDLN